MTSAQLFVRTRPTFRSLNKWDDNEIEWLQQWGRHLTPVRLANTLGRSVEDVEKRLRLHWITRYIPRTREEHI